MCTCDEGYSKNVTATTRNEVSSKLFQWRSYFIMYKRRTTWFDKEQLDFVLFVCVYNKLFQLAPNSDFHLRCFAMSASLTLLCTFFSASMKSACEMGMFISSAERCDFAVATHDSESDTREMIAIATARGPHHTANRTRAGHGSGERAHLCSARGSPAARGP